MKTWYVQWTARTSLNSVNAVDCENSIDAVDCENSVDAEWRKESGEVEEESREVKSQ